MPDLVITGPQPAPDVVADLLHRLPEWFGLPDSVRDYVQRAQSLPTYVARDGCSAVGVVVIDRPVPDGAVEVAVMAVDPAHHRRGIGRLLVASSHRHAAAVGATMLFVKTLGPTDPDPGYRATRAFYRSCGFVPLEELDGVWPGNPCLVLARAVAPASQLAVTAPRHAPG